MFFGTAAAGGDTVGGGCGKRTARGGAGGGGCERGGEGARTGTCFGCGCCCGVDAPCDATKTSGGIELSSIGAPLRADWSNS